MSPDRKEVVGDRKVEQYRWAGEDVVYVNNCLVVGTFDNVVEALKAGKAVEYAKSK